MDNHGMATPDLGMSMGDRGIAMDEHGIAMALPWSCVSWPPWMTMA